MCARGAHFPGLRAAPFWLEGDGGGAYAGGLEWLAELEAAVPRIRDELDHVLAAPLPAALRPAPAPARDDVMAASGATARALFDTGFYGHDSGYRQILLYNRARPQRAASLFPRALAALDDAGAPFGTRFVSLARMVGRRALHAHTDRINYMLTAHVPLRVPAAPRGGGAATEPDRSVEHRAADADDDRPYGWLTGSSGRG